MYGLIGKATANPGKRDELVAILLDTVEMPGCLSYIVAVDPADADVVWITEVWTDKESHDRSLQIPAVKEAIARAMPLFASFGPSFVTTPLGGHGLPRG